MTSIIASMKSVFSGQSNVDSAIRAREALDYPSVAPWKPSGMTTEEFQSIRISNQRKQLSGAPSISELVEVSMQMTSDTGQPVITLTDVSGKRWSLWVDGTVEQIERYVCKPFYGDVDPNAGKKEQSLELRQSKIRSISPY